MTSYLWNSLWSSTCLRLTLPLIPVSIPFSHPRPHWLPVSPWQFSGFTPALGINLLFPLSGILFHQVFSCLPPYLSGLTGKHYTLRKVISNLTNWTPLLLFHHLTLVYFFFAELILNHIVKCFPWLSTVPSSHTIKLHGKGNSSMHLLLSSA